MTSKTEMGIADFLNYWYYTKANLSVSSCSKSFLDYVFVDKSPLEHDILT